MHHVDTHEFIQAISQCTCHNILISSNKEPIQSVAPRIDPGEKFKATFASAGQTLNILCPPMAYPSPSHR